MFTIKPVAEGSYFQAPSNSSLRGSMSHIAQLDLSPEFYEILIKQPFAVIIAVKCVQVLTVIW